MVPTVQTASHPGMLILLIPKNHDVVRGLLQGKKKTRVMATRKKTSQLWTSKVSEWEMWARKRNV